MTSQQFLSSTWGQATKKELSLLRPYMYQLRNKLEAPSMGDVRIITEPQVGYRLKLNGLPDQDLHMPYCGDACGPVAGG